eukprot:scaffold4147_cov114-Isochrysis_galbana.AAC.5
MKLRAGERESNRSNREQETGGCTRHVMPSRTNTLVSAACVYCGPPRRASPGLAGRHNSDAGGPGPISRVH